MQISNHAKLALICVVVLLAMFAHSSNAQDSSQDFLDAHNEARQQVGVEAMAWDDTVAGYAQSYASQRIADCNMVHSGSQQYGENIAWSSGDLSGTDAVKMWVDEISYYDYGSNTCAEGQQCGHYTQVVWRNSKSLGCAKVRCDSGGTFITCNYSPRGNYNGEKPY